MKKYRYILFDLDGTLVYSHPGIYACFRYALEKMGVGEEPCEEVLQKCVGPSLEYSFATFFGMTEEDAKRATAFYRERYALKGVFENTPIPGALDCLKGLKEAGYILALATSKPKIFADKIAERFGFSEYLTVQIGPGMDGSLPTKTDVIIEAMRQLNAKSEECLMVGDREYDVVGARKAGVDCVGLLLGYAEQGEFARCNPAFVVKDFEELTALLSKNLHKQ